MKKLFILLLVLFSSCSQSIEVIYNFETCAAAGNPIMESYPEKCSDGKNTYTRIIDEPIVCTAQYDPVCALVEVQCIRAPCPPIKETFSNECFAGDNEILYKGECDDKGSIST